MEGEGFETGIGEMSLILRLSQAWKGILRHLQQGQDLGMLHMSVKSGHSDTRN